MRILLDTNRYCDFAVGDKGVLRVLQRAECVALPFVSLAELRAGFAAGAMQRENERILSTFLARERVSVLYPDEGTVRQYAAVYAQLRAQGSPIPTNDLWIAALAIQHDLPLLSRDRHFRKLAQLTLVDAHDG